LIIAVFITDDTGGELLPRWLGFLRGLVDSDTLPLNVSWIVQTLYQKSMMRSELRKKTGIVAA
jgi:heat shock protein beta